MKREEGRMAGCAGDEQMLLNCWKKEYYQSRGGAGHKEKFPHACKLWVDWVEEEGNTPSDSITLMLGHIKTL